MNAGASVSPTPEQIANARNAAGLTQAEAAALIWCSEIAWRQWEKGRNVAGARHMHPCFWWAFQQRLDAARPSSIDETAA